MTAVSQGCGFVSHEQKSPSTVVAVLRIDEVEMVTLIARRITGEKSVFEKEKTLVE